MTIIFISRNREQLGQFSEDDVIAGLQSGRFFGSDLAWKEGLAEWKPLSTFGLGSTIVVSGADSAVAVPLPGGWPVWEDAASVGWFKAWWETTYGALFSPVLSFSQMKTTGGYGKPLLYAAVCAALGGVVMGLTQGVLTMVMAAVGGSDAVAPGASLCAIPLVVGTTVVSSAIFTVLAVFVWGGLLHLFLMLFGGANQGFEATGRAVAYSVGAINTLYLVPILGIFAALIWGPVVYVIAIKEAQKTDYLRASLAVFLPWLLCCGAIGLIVFAAWGVIAAAMAGGV